MIELPQIQRPTPAVVASAALPTATIHEASGRRGALPGAIKPVDPSMRLVGPAFTVGCPPGDNLRIHHALYLAEPGDVLVVSVGGAPDHGYWGEILTVAAQERGLAGLVIDGGVRDRDRLIDIGFPVFSRTIDIRGTIKQPEAPGSIGSAVSIGDVRIEPGDVIVGDADGVVTIARADVEAVVQASLEREAAEAEQLDAIRRGARTIDLYGFDPELLR